MNISVQKVETSKVNTVDFEHLPFGKIFTDHMLEADCINGEWTNVQIKPYQTFQADPSMSVLHYGQAIFEGIKAYKDSKDNVYIFRPMENFHRFNKSAERMCMPSLPEWLFIDGMKKLIDIDRKWIPQTKDSSLYIRPFMFATDCQLGVHESGTYKFYILLSPSGPYSSSPMKIYVEQKYTRAAPGGVGFSKNAGNYGGSLIAAREAQKLGYDQVLWTDPFEHKWLQEVGMMNVFFVLNGKAVTPTLEDGTILDGVTRKSAITVLREEMGIEVEERHINIDELVEGFKKGTFTETFGTGTAAVVSFISKVGYKDTVMDFDVSKSKIAIELKERLDAIRGFAVEDKRGWMVKV